MRHPRILLALKLQFSSGAFLDTVCAGMPDAAKLLAELIALPSVNPAFVEPGDLNAGEKRVCDFLAATAAASGLDVELREVLPGRANLLARLEARGAAKRRVLLAPHMDTVGARPEQFTPTRKGDRLYGRGACDTKGSVAAMLTAVQRVAENPNRPRETEIIFCGFMDEEDGQSGSRALAKSGFKADLAIVGEPTKLQAVTAHKGDLWLKIVTKGKAAHGSKPHLGKNAVHAMCPIVEWLESDYARALRKRKHMLLGHPTVSVGAIRGGLQPNVVPDRCEILVDRRTIPGETERSVLAELEPILRKHGGKLENYKSNDCLPMETDTRLPLVRQFLDLSKQRVAAGVDFFCDAAVLAAAGIPCIVFGPGDIAQAHTADEWISLKSLERATAMLERFLLSLP
jgi:acetylornithine deacetylase/succinyl-diaminopimelate desuccinylase-like protein